MDLSSYDRETLIRWWWSFNSFIWPGDFPQAVPPEWKTMFAPSVHRSGLGNEAWRSIRAALGLPDNPMAGPGIGGGLCHYSRQDLLAVPGSTPCLELTDEEIEERIREIKYDLEHPR